MVIVFQDIVLQDILHAILDLLPPDSICMLACVHSAYSQMGKFVYLRHQLDALQSAHDWYTYITNLYSPDKEKITARIHQIHTQLQDICPGIQMKHYYYTPPFEYYAPDMTMKKCKIQSRSINSELYSLGLGYFALPERVDLVRDRPDLDLAPNVYRESNSDDY